MLTLRKKIVKVLEEECLHLQEISKLFGIKKEKSLIISSILPSRSILNALSWRLPIVNNVGLPSKKNSAEYSRPLSGL